MATLKAGIYVFKEVPIVANPSVQTGRIDFKSYFLTANNTYSSNLTDWHYIKSGSKSLDTNNTQIVCISNSTGDVTEFHNKTYEAERGWYQFYYADGPIEDRFTATDTTKLRTIIVETDQTVDDNFYTWFIANIEKPRISVDVSTLAGWANLSAGSHNITIVAKASGFKDSASSAAVQVTKAATMPAKGDIITLDSKQYRVLKTEGTVAEVLAMYDSTTSQTFDERSSGYNNTYANNSLDVYLSQTFYSSLSAAMQNAIVAKTFSQDSWYCQSGTTGGSGNPIYQGIYQTTNNYRLGLSNAAFGTSISRKCYVLSVQDVIDYLGVTTSMGFADTTLTPTNVWKMFWNQTTSPGSTYPWLRSAYADSSDYAFAVYGVNGNLDRSLVGNSIAVRPALQIDLSKISWSK